MLRVADLERSIAFHTGPLGMTPLRRELYPQGRSTRAFLGYGDETMSATIELTHNWDRGEYQGGEGYGHIALAVPGARAACRSLAEQDIKIVRQAGSMTFGSPDRSDVEVIAFIEDPPPLLLCVPATRS